GPDWVQLQARSKARFDRPLLVGRQPLDLHLALSVRAAGKCSKEQLGGGGLVVGCEDERAALVDEGVAAVIVPEELCAFFYEFHEGGAVGCPAYATVDFGGQFKFTGPACPHRVRCRKSVLSYVTPRGDGRV